MEEIKEKIKNSIRAYILGDALGVPFEFQEKGSFTCKGFTGFGTYNKPIGTWSDDTTVILCLLDALTKANLNFDKAEKIFKENLNAWYYEDKFTVDGLFDIGTQTSISIQSKFENSLTDRMGNGALFYLPLTFCFVCKELQKKDFIQFCKITHNNLNCFNYGWNLCLVIKNLLNEIADRIKLEEFKNRGDVINTFNLVLNYFYQLRESDLSLRDCLCRVINEGEDTDTNAAILGLLLGLIKEVDKKDWLMVRKHEFADQIIDEFVQTLIA
ncbi:MAG: ADP-ribosylglycohydrolase family protein [Parabacteroides sp.]|uniref:ADP-ribosylglycohydrolase family protein n=1 Tax=Parabacteroides faecalis TaxID=2924040 RepID=A0ABT0C0X1_9BACT|nr:ADP-ribosylglycohydrolase family protein [Parabacteroides faecalis]MCJ2380525.1 ADP-ribosylglycohydrolase family protein [Parabacteroides faecalis]MDD7560747.1 ADP-ribosylglycohydrolase family protein [Parabacteroides sp.]MDY5624030.1 ADP-ribosylglycohydrolase family protein [Bacteroidales bacterium]MDY6254646.1 ADP-ribosylglycohydrolase family protein [Bacteroidales bacterium]